MSRLCPRSGSRPTPGASCSICGIWAIPKSADSESVSNEDIFLIEDFLLIKQRCTAVTVQFDDEAVADYFDEQVDSGRHPEHCGRCWIHTHPGDSAEPSSTDEETFARAFGTSSWSVMFILARGGETYARLKFGCGPGAELLVPVEIAWDVPFAGTDHETWDEEYDQCVHPLVPQRFFREEHPDGMDMAILEEHPELLEDWQFWADHELQHWED